MKDRREFLRWQGSVPCSLQAGSKRLDGVVVDLSFSGARISHANGNLPNGSEVLLTLRPENEKILLKALVVHVEEGYFGVQFQGAFPDRLHRLKPLFRL